MTELGMCSGFVVEGCQCLACVQGLQAPDANWALKSFALCCLLLAVQPILQAVAVVLQCKWGTLTAQW